jgi:1-acyl-sn-glycerol-3-phosphate acyltransferase
MIEDLPPDFDRLARIAGPLSRFARAYHGLEIVGLEQLPAEGPALVVSTHSMFSYDLILGIIEIHRLTGRLVRGLADDFFWHIRAVGDWLNSIGIVRATPETARALLEHGELVGVCPGGMWEALKPSTERFMLRWESRRGFARLALQAQVPIVLATCPGADLLLTVHPSKLTDMVYRRFHLPLPIVHGLGPTLLPRPSKLRIHLAEPFMPPRCAGTQPSDEESEALRSDVHERMRAWVDRCVRVDGYSTM